jgi:hypothetical protein
MVTTMRSTRMGDATTLAAVVVPRLVLVLVLISPGAAAV